MKAQSAFNATLNGIRAEDPAFCRLREELVEAAILVYGLSNRVGRWDKEQSKTLHAVARQMARGGQEMGAGASRLAFYMSES